MKPDERAWLDGYHAAMQDAQNAVWAEWHAWPGQVVREISEVYMHKLRTRFTEFVDKNRLHPRARAYEQFHSKRKKASR